MFLKLIRILYSIETESGRMGSEVFGRLVRAIIYLESAFATSYTNSISK